LQYLCFSSGCACFIYHDVAHSPLQDQITLHWRAALTRMQCPPQPFLHPHRWCFRQPFVAYNGNAFLDSSIYP